MSAVQQSSDPVAAAAELQELVATLYLYISHHTKTQLTTSQRELLADAVDAQAVLLDEQDGLTGTSAARAPFHRWWRPEVR